MTGSKKHRLWKFLILGMICSIITGGSFVILSFSKPTQEGSCIPCHTAAGEPGAAPLTISVNTTYVEVQPSSTFYLEVSASGGEPDHMMAKFPNDVANNSLFTYSPREIYDGDDGSVDGSVSPTAVSITSPATQGLYTIRVFAATSAYGSYDKTATYADVSVNVTAQPPVASFTYSPVTPLVNETVTFNATESYDPDGTIVSYDWDFGDNTTGTGMIVNHVYTAAGTYTVTLTVTDNDGLTDATIQSITIASPPVAIFTYSPETPLVDQTVTFDASFSYDPDGTIVSYAWDFGDGNVTTTSNPIISHAYATAGTYNVTLTVTDNDGLTDTATAVITVSGVVKTMVFFNISPNPATVGETVTLKGILVDEDINPLGNEAVKLYARPLAGSWKYITSLTTNTFGIFMWQARIPVTGTFIFAVYYPGSEMYESTYNFAVLIVQ